MFLFLRTKKHEIQQILLPQSGTEQNSIQNEQHDRGRPKILTPTEENYVIESTEQRRDVLRTKKFVRMQKKYRVSLFRVYSKNGSGNAENQSVPRDIVSHQNMTA